MDSLEINKIVACVLVVALVIIGITNLSEILYEVEQPKVAHFQVEGLEDLSGDIEISAVVEAVEETSIMILLASADLGKGEKVFKKCSSCHVPNEGGANKIGPALYNVVGRAVGGVDDYKYSKALASYGKDWTFEELNGFLKKPASYLKGTKMSYAGLRKEKDRASIIKYLNQNGENPTPLP